MILTVTLNAAIDRTLAVPNFQLGRRHRATEQRSVAGGKGVNVARALKLLGRPVIATGLAGGQNGTRMVERLATEGILNDFTIIGEETRTNTAVIDPTSGQQTEINERGPNVTPEELDRFAEKLVYLAQGAAICVFAGSVPPGVDASVYSRLIAELNRQGLTTVLDTEGEALRAGLRAEPTFVSPNALEAEDVVGFEFADDEDRARGVEELVEMGARQALMTYEDGCMALVREHPGPVRLRAEIEHLEPVATVGSGDAFLAGYVAALYGGGSPRECLAFGVACGAQSTQHFGAGTVDPKEVKRLLDSVSVTQLQPVA